MVFSSLTCIFIFLPLMLGIYYTVPKELRSLILGLGSFAFIAYGAFSRPWMLLIFFGLSFVTYLLSKLVEGKRNILPTALGLTLIAVCLLGFKYAGLFTDMPVYFPLGLSFYSFQLAAYLIDVYRGDVAVGKLGEFLGIMLFFPKLISGPITDYASLAPQWHEKKLNVFRFDRGLREFTYGLALKVLLADQIGGLWTQLGNMGYESISTALAWLGIVAYSLQLYFDFFGYSLMAVGIALMLGFRLPDNFNQPYSATSVTEFWRRWHMTLGKWFLRYVYIPLGGSRVGKFRGTLNLLAVWIFTGVWHGATFNFIIWSVFLFVLIFIEKLGLKKILDKVKPLGHVYLITVIVLSWGIFALTDLGDLQVYFGKLFPFFGGEVLPFDDFFRLGEEYLPLLLVGVFCLLDPVMTAWGKLRQGTFGTIILLILFWLSIYTLSAGLNDPFLYFSF